MRHYSVCQVERFKHVRHGRMIGGVVIYDHESDVIEMCGTPLFGDAESRRGICNSCFEGWEADGNFPTSIGREQILKAAEKAGSE